LECLGTLRKTIQDLSMLNSTPNAVTHASIGADYGDKSDPNAVRWSYCLDYLRQTLLCHADDTFEPALPSAGLKTADGILDGMWCHSGYNCARQCRNSKALYDMTACGEAGCKGKKYFHPASEMGKIRMRENLLVAQLAERDIKASSAEVPLSPTVTVAQPTPPQPHARPTEVWSHSSSLQPVVMPPATTAEASPVDPELPELVEAPEGYQSRWDESRKGRGLFRGQRREALPDAEASGVGEYSENR